MTIIPVKIADFRQETPTIRVLKIDLLGQEFQYKPGQWIDCYVDVNDTRDVVGYSLASSPSTLPEFIELAIKTSDNPVTEYIHRDVAIGDTLYIEGGQGEVYYEKDMGEKVVLAAAGIGMASLMGILRYIDEATNSRVTLFQSASTTEELVYFDEIRERANSNTRISYYPMVTREDSVIDVGKGRITGETFERYGVDFDSLFFLSGPGDMIPTLKEYLTRHDVNPDRIKYEMWW